VSSLSVPVPVLERTPNVDVTVRRPRSDAIRNRVRVIAAARAELAEHGFDAQMEDVARRAGVGVGTVYRHFATKEALIDAALVARFEEALGFVREAWLTEDPWEAICVAFAAVAFLNAQDRCFSGVVAAQVGHSRALAPVKAELLQAWDRLFTRAQASGQLRADVHARDVPTLMCGLASVVVGAPDAASWRRYLTIVLDGLRAGHGSQLPLP
jgi:AcrR family transcriptional regulator